MKRMFLFWVLIINSPVFSFNKEVLDLEKLPTLRTMQYDLRNNKKVLVYTPYRTGSTLLYNIFRFLFEDTQYIYNIHGNHADQKRVKKLHNIPENFNLDHNLHLIISVLRHPKEACYSLVRVVRPKDTELEAWISFFYLNYFEILQKIKQLKSAGFDVLIFNYDDITKNLINFLEKMESILNIQITEIDKSLLCNGLSKENISKNLEKLSEFSQIKESSGFHGNHVSLEKYEVSEHARLLSDKYYEIYKSTFSEFGY